MINWTKYNQRLRPLSNKLNITDKYSKSDIDYFIYHYFRILH